MEDKAVVEWMDGWGQVHVFIEPKTMHKLLPRDAAFRYAQECLKKGAVSVIIRDPVSLKVIKQLMPKKQGS